MIYKVVMLQHAKYTMYKIHMKIYHTKDICIFDIFTQYTNKNIPNTYNVCINVYLINVNVTM